MSTNILPFLNIPTGTTQLEYNPVSAFDINPNKEMFVSDELLEAIGVTNFLHSHMFFR
jgi:hypothetical protein